MLFVPRFLNQLRAVIDSFCCGVTAKPKKEDCARLTACAFTSHPFPVSSVFPDDSVAGAFPWRPAWSLFSLVMCVCVALEDDLDAVLTSSEAHFVSW